MRFFEFLTDNGIVGSGVKVGLCKFYLHCTALNITTVLGVFHSPTATKKRLMSLAFCKDF